MKELNGLLVTGVVLERLCDVVLKVCDVGEGRYFEELEEREEVCYRVLSALISGWDVVGSVNSHRRSG